MPKYIILTNEHTEYFEGSLQELQERLKSMYDRSGIVPIWAKVENKPKRRYWYGKAR